MKGIILAGGAGTRLYPLTMVTSKHLLPVYDKPMIYYPLSTLMLSHISDILIISTHEDAPRFQALLGDGSRFGIKLSYKVQPSPDGLAQAFLIGEEFVGDEPVAMILGDNIFYGKGLDYKLSCAKCNAEKGIASVFGCYVDEPERFGILELNKDGRVLSIEEKPHIPKSNYAVTGLYFYPKGVSKIARNIQPSERGELEITTLNQLYAESNKLKVEMLDHSYTWIDAGTLNSLLKATEFVHMIEKQLGMKVSVPEEIAFHNRWVSREELLYAAKLYGGSEYGIYLHAVGNNIEER